MADDEEAPDPLLTPQQQKLVAALSPAQIRAIDLALLANIATHWRKMARIIGASMLDVESRAAGIPDIYYAERVRVLVERGLIESQGDMSRMRLGEVRFAVRTAVPDPKPARKPAASGAGPGRKGSVRVAASHLDAVATSADASWIDLSSFVEEAAPAKSVDADSGVSGSRGVDPGSQDASPAAASNLQAVAASASADDAGRIDSSSHEHAGALARGVEADGGVSGVNEVPPVSQDASEVAERNLLAGAASTSTDAAARIDSSSHEHAGALAKGVDADSGDSGVSEVDPDSQDTSQVAASNLRAVAASASADDADSGTSSADSANGMAPENKDATQATASGFDAVATLVSADDASRIDSSSNEHAANLAKDVDAGSGASNANADVGTVAGNSAGVSSSGSIATDSAGDRLASGDDTDAGNPAASGTDSAASSPAAIDTDTGADSPTIADVDHAASSPVSSDPVTGASSPSISATDLSLPDASDPGGASCEVSVSEAHGPDHF